MNINKSNLNENNNQKTFTAIYMDEWMTYLLISSVI